MCDKCVNIDYPIADSIWLPCGGPPDRYGARNRPPGYIPTTPRGGFSDEDFSMQEKVNRLMARIRTQQEEIARLRAKQQPPDPGTPGFEGVE